MKFSWFPGHMKKSLKELKEALPSVDVVIFMLDARVPASSFNYDLEKLVSGKKILFTINKTDLASPAVTSAWLNHFKGQGKNVVAISSKKGSIKSLIDVLEKFRSEICEARAKRGRVGKTIRIMAVGVPNSGKSTIINRLAKKSVSPTGKKAGLTRGFHWLSIGNDMELLDMPGIFYPKLKSEDSAWHLAAVGAARDVAFPVDDLSYEILKFLKEREHEFTADIDVSSAESALSGAGKKRNFIKSGGNVDYDRTAMWVMTNFRDGKFGSFSLEFPESEN